MQGKYQKPWRRAIKRFLMPLICGVLLSGCAHSPTQSAKILSVQATPTPLPATVTASDSDNVKRYSEKVRDYSAMVSSFLQKARDFLQSSQETKPH